MIIGGMVLISHYVMNLPGTMVQQLILIMMLTGILISIASYSIYRSGLLQHFASLRWLLLLIVLFTVGVVLLNLWLLSRIMFISTHYFSIVTTMMFFAGLTAVGFGYFASKAMTERLFKLADAAGQVAQGDFSTRLEVKGRDEIAHLTASFNAMARDLQTVDEQKRLLEQTRRDLVTWVSHDLRTPLTSMRVMLEALADGVIQDKETQDRYIQTSLQEIEHLSHLINDLFELAQLDVGHLQLDFFAVPLGELVSDTLASLNAKAQKKQIQLEGKIDEGIELVEIAPDKIQRVLKNLLDNAIKYSPAGARVAVHVQRPRAGMVQVDVQNTGISIAEETLPRLFESFYRGEKSRASSDDERGTGLGLAIARGFIQAHGGEIWAESAAQTGTIFHFTIPERQGKV